MDASYSQEINQYYLVCHISSHETLLNEMDFVLIIMNIKIIVFWDMTYTLVGR